MDRYGARAAAAARTALASAALLAPRGEVSSDLRLPAAPSSRDVAPPPAAAAVVVVVVVLVVVVVA
jgi:hypothetical protein